jgi:hypothetical protein
LLLFFLSHHEAMPRDARGRGCVLEAGRPKAFRTSGGEAVHFQAHFQTAG